MGLIHHYFLLAMWLIYVGYWWAKALNVKANERTEPILSRGVRITLIVIAIILWATPRFPIRFLNSQFFPRGEWSFSAGVALTAAGLTFSIWARNHLWEELESGREHKGRP